MQHAVLSDEIDLTGSAVYACGSEKMIRSAKYLLVNAGLDEKVLFRCFCCLGKSLVNQKFLRTHCEGIILAGGLGTRLSEETSIRPKPLVEIGGYPILWHIMKMYSSHGINDFIICCGYKGYLIKEYFNNYFFICPITFNMRDNKMKVHNRRAEPWTVTLVDAGDASMTGGRLKRVSEFVKDEQAFCFTYGDGVGDINISKSIDFHLSHNRLATLTATYPPE